MKDQPTPVELVLQLHGEFRQTLEPLRVTPLQAGVLLFLQRHAEAKVSDGAAALRVSLPTMSEVVKDLVRNRWVTRHRSVTDARVVHLRLSRLGLVLTRKIEHHTRRVKTGLA
jgi:DNA-binding MarR family transcriptional regulator